MPKGSTEERRVVAFRQEIRTLLRQRLTETVETVVEEELAAAIGSSWHERSESRRGYRNGSRSMGGPAPLGATCLEAVSRLSRRRRRSTTIRALRRAGCLSVLLLLAPLAGLAEQRGPVVGLDHIPVAVRDLERASADFRALVFAIKPGRDHANGIRTAHVKFRDGSGIELITAGAAVDELTTRYVDLLAHGEGPAFVALHAVWIATEAGAELERLLVQLGGSSARRTVLAPDSTAATVELSIRARS